MLLTRHAHIYSPQFLNEPATYVHTPFDTQHMTSVKNIHWRPGIGHGAHCLCSTIVVSPHIFHFMGLCMLLYCHHMLFCCMNASLHVSTLSGTYIPRYWECVTGCSLPFCFTLIVLFEQILSMTVLTVQAPNVPQTVLAPTTLVIVLYQQYCTTPGMT